MEVANNRSASIISRAFGNASVQTLGEDATGSIRLNVVGLDGNWTLRALWAGEGWPADIERAFERFPPGPLPADVVLTARRLSPGSLDLLSSRQANWADEQGGASIRGTGLLIVREGSEPLLSPADFSWSPSAVAVAEALLARPWPEGIGTSELAGLVDWSPPQVSQVLLMFDGKGWTAKYGPQRGPSARRELGDTADLLSAWATQLAASERDFRLTHRTIRSPLDFLAGELGEALSEEVRWAASGWAAARELAPITDAVPSLQIYVHEDDFGQPLDRVLRATELTDVAEGGRVAFIPAHPSVLALGRQGSNAPLVSAPRVYADLLAIGGRGADAGTYLREVVLDHLSPPPAGSRPPVGLVEWERSCRDRLKSLTKERLGNRIDPYAQGSWSASYRLTGLRSSPDLRYLAAVLREVTGRETGWPAWRAPHAGENRPHPIDGLLECWFADMIADEPAHADFWRADPTGRLCLIRVYEEDSEYRVEPRTALDLILPIWRTGECLLHAERLARRLDADGIQMMLRWTGLRGRRLAALEGPPRFLSVDHFAETDEVVSYLHTTPDEVRDSLAAQVRTLLDPLYETFDLFEPPRNIYDDELGRMRQGGAGRG